MACIEKSYNSNFLKWNKVTGSLTMAELQANGMPSDCNNITITGPSFLLQEEDSFILQEDGSKIIL
jgi:hypothetical protein